MTRHSTPEIRARAVERYNANDPIDEIAAEAGVTTRSVLAWVKDADPAPRGQGQRRRRARRPDIPAGLIRWLYEEVGLSHAQIARMARMSLNAEWERYYGEINRDEIADAAEVGAWLGARRPDLLLASLKYVAVIATAMSADGKRAADD